MSPKWDLNLWPSCFCLQGDRIISVKHNSQQAFSFRYLSYKEGVQSMGVRELQERIWKTENELTSKLSASPYYDAKGILTAL